MDIRFAIESYKIDSRPVSSQRCLNAYAETQPKSAKSSVAVYGAFGVESFGEAGGGPIRGSLDMNGIGYVVSGDQLYSFASDGTTQLIGGGITGSNIVSMAGNGFEIVIVNGSFGYSYLLADGTFVQIADPDFHPSNTVTVVNSIFVFDWPDTNKFFISAVLDGRTYSGLDFASAESNPDFVLAVRNRSGLLMLFGEKTIEPWDNTGASSFPFARLKGGTIDRGVASSLAIESEDSSIFFLGNDRVFYRLNGLQLLRISQFALEKEWENYAVVDDAFCFKIPLAGHKFIYLTFPSENHTWVYDIATQLWHERTSWDPSGVEIRWRFNTAIAVFSKVLVGDSYSGIIGRIDHDIYTELNTPIITELVSPPIYQAGKQISIPSFELDMETGTATTPSGGEPMVMMSYSDDGGYNFVAPEEWLSAGAVGVRETRLIWNSLGSAYQFCIKVRISDPIRRVITGARCPELYAE